MPRMTIQQQIVRGLERLGYEHTPHPALRKYQRFVKPGSLDFVYVGKAGSVRGGATQAESVPLVGLKARALVAGCSEKVA